MLLKLPYKKTAQNKVFGIYVTMNLCNEGIFTNSLNIFREFKKSLNDPGSS